MATEQDEVVTLPVVGSITYREIHAFINGVYCGYVGQHKHEYWQEKHYWRGGYLLGDKLL